MKFITRFLLSYSSSRTLSAARIATKLVRPSNFSFANFGIYQLIRFLIGEWVLSLLSLVSLYGIIMIIISLFDETFMTIPFVVSSMKISEPIITEISAFTAAVGETMFPSYNFFWLKVVSSIHLINVHLITYFNYSDIISGLTANLGADATILDKLGNVAGVINTYYFFPYYEFIVSPYIAYKTGNTSVISDTLIVQTISETYSFIKDGIISLISDIQTLFFKGNHIFKVDFQIYTDDMNPNDCSNSEVELTTQPNSSNEMINSGEDDWTNEHSKYFKEIKGKEVEYSYNCHPCDYNNHTFDDCTPQILDFQPCKVNKFEALLCLGVYHPAIFGPLLFTSSWYIGKALYKISSNLLF